MERLNGARATVLLLQPPNIRRLPRVKQGSTAIHLTVMKCHPILLLLPPGLARSASWTTRTGVDYYDDTGEAGANNLPPGGGEMPSHRCAAAAEDSKKRKMDDEAASETALDKTMATPDCLKCGQNFTFKSNPTPHKNTCRGLMMHVCPGIDGAGSPADYSTKENITTTETLQHAASVLEAGEGALVCAGRSKRAAADVKKGIGPGVDKVRKQQNLQPKPFFDETGCFCMPHCSCDHCPEQKQKASILLCVQHTAWHGAATNSVMGIAHNDDEEMESLIEKCTYVPGGTKGRLQKEWETEHMAHGRSFPSCVACGIRN